MFVTPPRSVNVGRGIFSIFMKIKKEAAII
jgi:hypothetical protein